MRRSTALFTLGITVLATAVAGVDATATARPTDPGRAVSGAEQDASLRYWTAPRMAQARQLGGTVDEQAVERAVRLEAGRDMEWRSLGVRKTGTGPRQGAPVKGSAWTGGGKVTRTVGKVYFSLPSGDYTCTATSVDSANRSTLITAGHCVYQQGAYAERWVFVPGATPTREPYGRWAPAKMYPSQEWVAGADVNHDYAFVTLAPRNGRKLADVVGSLPVTFTGRGDAPLTSFGYSGAAPHYGSRLVYCRGKVVPDTFGTSSAQGQACTMVSGSSGGPRLTAFDGSAGTVTAVNSFTYSSGPSEPTLWAAPLGPSARTLYTQASR